MGLLGATRAQVFTGARVGCVIHRCQNKTPDRNRTRRCEWRHAPEAWAEIWEKGFSWVLASEEYSWLSGLAEIRPIVCSGVQRVVVGGWRKSQYRKIVYHSPYVEKPFNSKVIKSFVPELRSRKCFSCFAIPMFYIYEYELSMYISHIPVWLCYIYIYMWGDWLVGFNGISIFECYLMPNLFLCK